MQNYDELFGGQQGGELTSVSQFGTKWGWYSSIYAIAKGRLERFEHITKLKVHECLLFLTFEKEKNEIEKKQIKNKF
jgi:hypothetical protein|tara:strand:+ start:186 stop:416 length:231 start_codon:yes stop_codon:yes gene_type:complete